MNEDELGCLNKAEVFSVLGAETHAYFTVICRIQSLFLPRHRWSQETLTVVLNLLSLVTVLNTDELAHSVIHD